MLGLSRFPIWKWNLTRCGLKCDESWIRWWKQTNCTTCCSYHKARSCIFFHKELCSEINYTPLSKSCLWRILRSLKPSRRKSLSGLDDITADGMNGFLSSHNTYLSLLKKYKDLVDQLEHGKHHLKIRYQSHCCGDSTIKSHNSRCALGTPKEEQCLDIHDDF